MGSLPDALIASQVGIWETDLGNDRTVADAVTAALFNLDSMQAALGLPLAAYVEAILPADREAFFTSLDRVSEHGGVFVGEYRVSSGARGVQWVLARGHFERDEQTGEVVGRGIVVNTTESKLKWPVEDRTFFVLHKNEPPLERLATYALQARRVVDDVGEHERSALRLAVDSLLWAVGRAIARQNHF
ncbi:PAS domain-containing protein [Methylorubrum thiocyanatum]|uniref:diguanylate cyclase n=1 Tax=Methylorubrum thiocyanatum TaxID=47958 RepID=UPI00398C73AC